MYLNKNGKFLLMNFKLPKITSLAFLISFGMVSLSTGASFFLIIYPFICNQYEAHTILLPLTIAIFLVGKSLGSMISGFLSDAYGRRKVMLLGLILFIFGNILCFINYNIEFLVFGRFIQGLGANSYSIIGVAMIRDLYDGKFAAQTISRVGNIYVFSSAIVPIAAGYIAIYFSWRYTFFAMILLSGITLCTLIFMDESLPPEKRTKIKVETILSDMMLIFSDKNYSFFNIQNALLSFGYQCFYAISPLIYVKYFHIPVQHITYYALIGSVLFVIGGLVNRLLIRFMSLINVVRLGALFYTVGGGVFLYTVLAHPENALIQRFGMGLSALALGFVITNSITLSQATLKSAYGLASSMRSVSSNMFMALGIYAFNYVAPASFVSLAYVYILTGLLSMVMMELNKEKFIIT